MSLLNNALAIHQGNADRYSPDSRVGEINRRPIEVSKSIVSSNGSCKIIDFMSLILAIERLASIHDEDDGGHLHQTKFPCWQCLLLVGTFSP